MTTDKNHIPRYQKYGLEYINGAIIGEAEVIDCILIDEELNKEILKNENYPDKVRIGLYAWKLANIKNMINQFIARAN